ncbi:hypothetical protein [Metabacillus fastidiosus]|uniref:Uncharacterized protein n=1 Tax=Metabacillus fastidiosus TaxID=1458 RepID=A0ABU6P4V3_9BACI|nr:hypothetical protein [Metabacillus fastidiosus]
MSFTVEYNRVIYKKDRHTMVLLVKQGDSNVYDSHSNLRAKHWRLAAAGSEKELWKEIGIRSGSTEGGALQRAKGWNETVWWKIEDYIKLYRSKIANAKPIDSLLTDFSLTLVIERNPHSKNADLDSHITTIIDDFQIPYVQTHHFDTSRLVYEKPVENQVELYTYLERIPVNFYSKDFSIFYKVDCHKTRI